MTVYQIKQFDELEQIAAAIGRNEGRDFSFIAIMGGRKLRATVQHNGQLADIRPASKYEGTL